MFKENKIRVKTACNKKSILEIIDNPNKINLILIDLHMPEMDGLELTK